MLNFESGDMPLASSEPHRTNLKNASYMKEQEQGTAVKVLKTANQSKKVIIRMKELQGRIGLGRSAIYYLRSEGPRHDPSFPRAIKLTSHSVGFLVADVEAWIDSRIQKSLTNKTA